MPDSKNVKWVADLREEEATPEQAEQALAPDQPAANDADGWQKYRHWISKAPAPRGRRVGIDPSLYTWKGYRNWTDEVRRNWDPEDDDSSA
jgi:hypothetical protein